MLLCWNDLPISAHSKPQETIDSEGDCLRFKLFNYRLSTHRKFRLSEFQSLKLSICTLNQPFESTTWVDRLNRQLWIIRIFSERINQLRNFSLYHKQFSLTVKRSEQRESKRDALIGGKIFRLSVIYWWPIGWHSLQTGITCTWSNRRLERGTRREALGERHLTTAKDTLESGFAGWFAWRGVTVRTEQVFGGARWVPKEVWNSNIDGFRWLTSLDNSHWATFEACWIHHRRWVLFTRMQHHKSVSAGGALVCQVIVLVLSWVLSSEYQPFRRCEETPVPVERGIHKLSI